MPSVWHSHLQVIADGVQDERVAQRHQERKHHHEDDAGHEVALVRHIHRLMQRLDQDAVVRPQVPVPSWAPLLAVRRVTHDPNRLLHGAGWQQLLQQLLRKGSGTCGCLWRKGGRAFDARAQLSSSCVLSLPLVQR